MTRYHHYKNNPYKLLGFARHSETLEEMALYETRYENTLGTLWVRPKAMFFENIDLNGQSVPRFKPITVDFHEFHKIQDDTVERLASVIEQAFGEWDPKWFASGLARANGATHLILALIDNKTVGFKLGYQTEPEVFYSWLGGMTPDFRGLGIATELMKRQHLWCRTKGYKKIETTTRNCFRSMLLLNIRHGFNITGTEESNERGMKIRLEKILDN